MNIGSYGVKSVKTFNGMDCEGFNAVLTLEGKPIANVVDDGSGGDIMIHWLDCTARPRVDVQWVDPRGQPHTIQGCTPAEAQLYEHLRGQTAQSPFDGHVYQIYPDELIGYLVDAFLNDKRFRRLCKTKTLLRVQGDPEGEYRTYNHVYDDRMKAYLQQKYGATIVEILNDKYA